MHHSLPQDLKLALSKNKSALSAWQSITPLARNEFICWVISPKKQETRAHRIKRTIEELVEGKRRPCCWAGCIHQ
ncbi:MAG TPA: YdeI/OmpD-associated family protein [Parcubacteria group bacterium]|jgi:uncharacterized protein YdeI (YjbR/CyaY-like superfamily)|nr:YdeI/OmpD-associated family protein [Parcubacteria group bacterium]